jgi:hypothetical protein
MINKKKKKLDKYTEQKLKFNMTIELINRTLEKIQCYNDISIYHKELNDLKKSFFKIYIGLQKKLLKCDFLAFDILLETFDEIELQFTHIMLKTVKHKEIICDEEIKKQLIEDHYRIID